MATKQLTSLDTYVLPRVNLLPPEIGEKKAERRSYAFMGIVVAAGGATVVALYLGQAARVAAAEQELSAAKSQNQTLVAERARLQTVEDVYAAVDSEEALVTRAFENRVFWSVYLHNVSIRIPDNVWITQFTGTAGVATADQAAVAAGAAVPVGSLTFTGMAFGFNDVAAWLDGIAKTKGVANATFSTIEDEKSQSPSARTIVKFTSTAGLTPAAITPHKKPGSR